MRCKSKWKTSEWCKARVNERVVQGDSGESKTGEWGNVRVEDKSVVQGKSGEWETREYGVATFSRLLKIIGLFCKKAL